MGQHMLRVAQRAAAALQSLELLQPGVLVERVAADDHKPRVSGRTSAGNLAVRLRTRSVAALRRVSWSLPSVSRRMYSTQFISNSSMRSSVMPRLGSTMCSQTCKGRAQRVFASLEGTRLSQTYRQAVSGLGGHASLDLRDEAASSQNSPADAPSTNPCPKAGHTKRSRPHANHARTDASDDHSHALDPIHPLEHWTTERERRRLIRGFAVLITRSGLGMLHRAGTGQGVGWAHLAQGGLAVEEGAVHACSDGVQKPDGCHGQVVLCRAGTFRPAVIGKRYSMLHLTETCAKGRQMLANCYNWSSMQQCV